MGLETDHIVETSTKTTIEEGGITIIEVVVEIIGPTIETTVGPELGAVTEMITDTPIDQTTEGKMVIKGIKTEIKIAVDPGIEIGGIEAAPEKALTPEVVPKTDMKVEARVEIILETGTGPSLDLDPLLM